MSIKNPINPFYAALVLAGVAFGVTALAYGAMSAIAHRDPEAALESIESGQGLVAFMDQHGFRLMMIELAVLAITTVLAIGTDGYWTKVANRETSLSSAGSDSSVHHGANQ